MTIDEAIAKLTDLVSIFSQQSEGDRAKALKLGIEALKRIIEEHEDDELLPGETKD